MTRTLTIVAILAFAATFTACTTEFDTSTGDDAFLADHGASYSPDGVLDAQVNLYDRESDSLAGNSLNGPTHGMEGAAPHMSAIELTAGQELVRAIDQGVADTFEFATQWDMKYDVIVNTASGNVDLFTHLSQDISTIEWTCSSNKAGEGVDACNLTGGTSGQYYAMAEGVDASVYSVLLVESPISCGAGAPGVCSPACPCGLDEGTCDADEGCATGLSCLDNVCSY
jgi:hypothetical protein